MEETSRLNKYLVALVVADLLLAILFLYILLDFKNSRLAEVGDLNTELISLQSTDKMTSTINWTIKKNKGLIDRLNFYFITKETTANFIEELESIALRSGVTFKLNSLSIGKEEKITNKPSYLKLTMRFDGSFSNVHHFLTILENLPYRVRFNSINIARLDTEAVVDKKDKVSPPWYGDVSLDMLSYVDR